MNVDMISSLILNFINKSPLDTGTNIIPYSSYIVPLIILTIIFTLCFWKILEKAGEEGWKSLVPIYNTYTIYNISGMNIMYFIVDIVSYVIFLFTGIGVIGFICNIIYIVFIDKICNNFGKGIGFKVGTFFLPFIFYPILAFGKSAYINNNK